MKNNIKKIVVHPLVSGSSIVFIGFLVANILNFAFNISMIHLLSKTDYGALITLTSLFVLLGVFQQSFQSSFAKFAASYTVLKSQDSLYRLTVSGFKIVLVFSLIVLITFLILTPLIMDYLHFNDLYLLLLVYVTVCTTVILALPIGIIQGQMRFYLMSFANLVPPILKIVLGVLFVLAGWKVFGAVLAIMLGTTIGTSLLFWYLYKEFKVKSKSSKSIYTKGKLYKYWRGFFITSVGMTILSSTDVILVRHFFSESVTGQYAVLALAGRSIFYFTAPLNFAFFPLIAQKIERKEKVLGTLLLAIGIVVGISSMISLVYFVFPSFVISVFTFGKGGYEEISPYLGPFSLYILVFSVASILNSFFLSIGKTRIYMFTVVAAVLQVVLIYLFHSTLFEVVGSLFVVSLLLSIAFIAYYVINEKN